MDAVILLLGLLHLIFFIVNLNKIILTNIYYWQKESISKCFKIKKKVLQI